MSKGSEVLQEMARMRAETEARPMTIAEAVDKVRWVERTPDGILDPIVAKRVMATLLGAIEASPCYFKAVTQNIPSFTLLATDHAGHRAILLWSSLAEEHGARPEKYESARKMVIEWIKRPDLRWPT
jgi:hypothetical protein